VNLSAKTFEQALAELEAIVHELEEGKIGLEDALARYEQGVGLLKHGYALLRNAEQRIMQLAGVDEQGRPIVQPFPAGNDALPAEQASTQAGGRRKRSGGNETETGSSLFGDRSME